MLSDLRAFFNQQSDVCVAFLFGSRARGAPDPRGWDIAVLLEEACARIEGLSRLERLRFELAKHLSCATDQVDLIDLRYAPLNLCITVADEAKVLKGSESLELFRFYQRAWSTKEEFHFRKAHGH